MGKITDLALQEYEHLVEAGCPHEEAARRADGICEIEELPLLPEIDPTESLANIIGAIEEALDLLGETERILRKHLHNVEAIARSLKQE